MGSQLPREVDLSALSIDRTAVEKACLCVTKTDHDVVAVAVPADQVHRSASLLFGTGVGVVGSIAPDEKDPIDRARRLVAQGATEIALPPVTLEQSAIVTRLRSRLGPETPVTVGLPASGGRLDLSLAHLVLQLGADYVSYPPVSQSPIVRHDVAALLDMASQLPLARIKVSVSDLEDQAWLDALAATQQPGPGLRLCVPPGSVAYDLRP